MQDTAPVPPEEQSLKQGFSLIVKRDSSRDNDEKHMSK
jgi:hypothetical protein